MHNSSRDTKPKPLEINVKYRKEEEYLSEKILAGINLKDKELSQGNKLSKPDELVVLWTSGDREVALKMAFMYTFNCKRFKWGGKKSPSLCGVLPPSFSPQTRNCRNT
jgi:hypothetical protein